MLQAVETASESENSDREGESRYYIMYEKGKEVSTYQKNKSKSHWFWCQWWVFLNKICIIPNYGNKSLFVNCCINSINYF